MDNSLDYSSLQNPAIPTIVPPAVDPSLVDFREFYPYIPNEIKHRKRTTQAQLEILEQTFAHDKKPNGLMRGNLARQLDMTPRGVQVNPKTLTLSPPHPDVFCYHRFGSRTGARPHLISPRSSLTLSFRRAKEKTLAKKATTKLHQPQPPPADSPESQEGAGANGSTSSERASSTATDSKHPSISPSVSPPTLDAPEPSQDVHPAVPHTLSARYDLRRCSLPTDRKSVV